jgi:4-amino-4-deoxy-L-arabinose transferase-like glycosyltransferase
MVVSALLNLWALGRNDWANTYYSAAVRSMAVSWHDFLYASLDRSGVMTVDKPPLSLWVQSLSVRVFGFHPLAILVPQALMGIASIVLVYDLVRRRFGRLGGFAAGVALATTPIFVATSRDNNPDALLMLCCLAAVWFAVRGFEDGRTRWLVLSGVAVGLGFETKMLVALVVVPAIAIAWLWITPRGRGYLDALRQVLWGGLVMLVVGGAWPLLVALTPAGDRPWVSGTSDNSILSLIFGYNGLGRVTGQTGGPAGLFAGGGSKFPFAFGGPGGFFRQRGLGGTGGGAGGVFGEGIGPLRLLNTALGGQDGWLLGLAVAGLLAVLFAARVRRRDPRTAWIAVVGGAFLVTAALFSYAHGIFHPYYVVLLAPFTAALVGALVATVVSADVAFAGALALGLGVAAELAVRGNYGSQLGWMAVVLPLACGAAAVALLASRGPRVRAAAMSLGVAVLLIAPTIWAVDTLGYANASTFPAGGPASDNAAAGPAGGGGGGVSQALVTAEQWAASHGGGTIAVSAQNGVDGADAAILANDANVAGIGGFSGAESDPSIAWLAGEVAAGRIRWVLDQSAGAGSGFGFGGPGLFGGNAGSGPTSLFDGGRPTAQPAFGGRPGASAAIAAAAQACKPVSSLVSSDIPLYDCAGRAAALRALG